MGPSPRKSAPSTFVQTWHETDAASFDPASLPVSKATRAWERKAETTVLRDGKEKKVWRRYTTRSKLANNASPDECDEEEDDSRYRAVKKQQCLRPKEMEYLAAMPKERKRAFKTTRWERRKSVLPRKHSEPVDNEIDAISSADDIDERTLDAVDASTQSVEESALIEQQDEVATLVSIVNGDRRRSTFSFVVEEDTTDDTPGSNLPESTESHEPEGATAPESDVKHQEVPSLLLPSAQRSPIIETLYDAKSSAADEICTPNNATSGISEEGGPDFLEITEKSKMAELHIQTNDGEDVSSPEDRSFDLGEKYLGQTDTMEQHLANAAGDIVEPPAELVERLASAEVEDSEDVEMSGLPLDISIISPQKHDKSKDLEANPIAQSSLEELTLDFSIFSPQKVGDSSATDVDVQSESSEEEFTEASLQLEIQRDVGPSEAVSDAIVPVEPQEEFESTVNATNTDDDFHDEAITETNGESHIMRTQAITETPADDAFSASLNDIADGLTLAPSLSTSIEPTSQKLRSPSPSPPTESGPDDVTTTMHLDDDTALLKDFLTRAAANKANKAANIARRTSLQNRRDSDAVRHALASPRKILEDKDPNSPSKYDNDVTLDLSQTLTLNMDQQPPLSPTHDQADGDGADGKASKSSRRSTRTRKSRLPAPSSASQQAQVPKNISVRRADGGEPIVLKKTEAQELGLLTRANTRKNKQGAVAVSLKLLKLATEAALSGRDDTMNSAVETKSGMKNVRWDETLAYYQEGTETLASTMAEAQSLATPDELSVTISTPSAKKKAKENKDKKNETPRIRRVRGLGAANGTPGKGLLAPSGMLPEGLIEEKDATSEKPQRLPKASKLKKMVVASTSADTAPSETQLPPLQVAPVGLDGGNDTKASKERKSRLATPRKVKWPQAAPAEPTMHPEGKENQQQSRGLGGATPKKGLKLPEVVVPPVVESGLPRRRAGRKV